MIDAVLTPAGASGPPPIPGARSDSTGHRRRPLVIWVRTGTARVRIDDAEAFHLTAGDGVWIPADGWNHRAIITEPGSVAFPLWPHPDKATPSEPTRFEVPDPWQDWLIQHFNLQTTPLSGLGYSQGAIIDLLRRSGSRPSAAAPSGKAAPSRLLDLPAMPKTRAARAVAEELMRDPALDLTVEQWASRVLSSPRSLRRDFHAASGLTFERWRLRCRLNAAVDLLAAGYGVNQVGARVGFSSRSGFTRAFQQQFGPTPHELARKLSATASATDRTQHATMARQRADLTRMVYGTDSCAGAPALLPAARTPLHANNMHVLSWMYRGSGYLDIDNHRYERQRGVATWIPADVEHTTGIRENSISLPLGTASTVDLRLPEPLQVQFSPAWDNFLMYCSISARSILRPDGDDHRRIIDLFAEQVAVQRALSVPMPIDPRARAAAMNYLRRSGTSGQSAAFDVPAEVHRAFRDDTGMTFARWRYAARMRIARDLLIAGATPSAAARRVGYAHLPTFSAAFKRFHGLSPREYQEREAGNA